MRRRNASTYGRSRKWLDNAAQLATGDGVDVDLAQAAKIYRREMNAGSGEAAFNLATMYARGEGVSRSWPTSVRLLKRAERLGSSDASVLLAELRYEGTQLLKRDATQSFFHCALALLRGDARGQRLMQKILMDNPDEQTNKLANALKRAVKAAASR